MVIIGGSLEDVLRDEDGYEFPLSVHQSLYYLQQTLSGVQFLHQNGVLHLDICGKYYVQNYVK